MTARKNIRDRRRGIEAFFHAVPTCRMEFVLTCVQTLVRARVDGDCVDRPRLWRLATRMCRDTAQPARSWRHTGNARVLYSNFLPITQ